MALEGLAGLAAAFLGGAPQGYMQAQQQQQQQRIREQALQELQRKRDADAAAFSAFPLLGRAPMSALANIGGIGGGGGMPGGAPAMPPGAFPIPQTQGPAQTLWADPGQNVVGQSPGGNIIVDNAGGGAEIPLDPGTPSADVIQRAAAEPAPPGAAAPPTSSPSQEQPVDPAPNVPTNEQGRLMLSMGNQSLDIAQFFGNHLDPQTIAAAVLQARPGIDPATAMLATERLYKLTQTGDKTQQLQALGLLKWLMPSANVQLQQSNATARAAGSQNLQQQRIDQGGQRLDLSRTSEARRGEQGNRRLDQGDARIAQGNRRLDEASYQRALRRADQTQQRQLSELHRQISEIDRQVQQAINQGQLPDKALLENRKQMEARERGMADKLLGGDTGQ